MSNLLRRLLRFFNGKQPEVEPTTLLPQYSKYFKKKYGLTVWCGGKDLFVKKPDGTVTRLENADSLVETFDFVDRIGKAL